MPRIVEQPTDLGAFPRLCDEDESRRFLKEGMHKWRRTRDEIEYIKSGRFRLYAFDALIAHLKRNTVKPKPLDHDRPRPRVGRPPKVRAKSTPRRKRASDDDRAAP